MARAAPARESRQAEPYHRDPSVPMCIMLGVAGGILSSESMAGS